MLWLALHFHRLPLDVCARDLTAGPQVVVSSGRNGSILSADAAAAEAGIRPGMPLSAAWALASTLRVYARNAYEERAALERCAAAVLAFTPLIVLAPPAVLLAEIEGSAHLFSGVAALRARLCALLKAQGYAVRPALAPTPLAADWLAREGIASDVRERERLQAALAPLPLRVLDLAPAIAATLAGIGLRTLGDCLNLPRAEFSRRFGAGIRDALDRALGLVPDPREPFTAPMRFQTRLELPAPVSEAAALLFAARRLLRELADFLAGTGRGVARFTLMLEHAQGEPTQLTLALAGLTRDGQRLERLLRERCERLVLARPVEALALTAHRLRPLTDTNAVLFREPAQNAAEAAQLIERLRARLGEESVQELALVADHRPERAWRYRAADASSAVAFTQRRPLWLLPSPRRLPRCRTSAPASVKRSACSAAASASKAAGGKRTCHATISSPVTRTVRTTGSTARPAMPAATGICTACSGKRLRHDAGLRRAALSDQFQLPARRLTARGAGAAGARAGLYGARHHR